MRYENQTRATRPSGCGAKAGSIVGGPSGGQVSVSSDSSCTLVITMAEGAVAPNAWSCWMNNLTTPTSVMQQWLGGASSPQAAASAILSIIDSSFNGITMMPGAEGTVTLSNFTAGGLSTATGAVVTVTIKDAKIVLVQITHAGYDAVTGTLTAGTAVVAGSGITASDVSFMSAASNIAAVFTGTPGDGVLNYGCMAY